MTKCKHDPQYTVDNESAGGVGCPICNAERRAASIQIADAIIPAGTCPICGLSLTAHPHGESECQELIQYDEMRFYDAGAELAQARIDYRLGC